MKNDKSFVIGGGALWNPNRPTVTYEPGFDPDNPPHGWVLIENNEDFCRYQLAMDDGSVVEKTEHKNTKLLLEQNQRQFNDSAGRKWGDGDVIGRMPTHEYWRSGLAEANRQGDRKYQKKFWNDADNRKWRIREGDL